MMNEPNDKTLLRTRRMPFRPSRNSGPERSVNVLPVGTHLGEFEILDLIGEGGFGIVYLAYDHSLERHVALKEYMPSGLATRTTKMAVTVRSEHNAPTFTAGLKSFINEARMLAQFDSPSLVKVHRFWEGNGTAYMVMPFYEGTTLKQALAERRIKPTEAWIRLLLADLFDAIEIIHHAHCLHRDIAPDNILLLNDGRPLLLDFGAARRVIGDLTQCLTAILKPGYAPIEQYADIDGLRQGAWTDIYALAAVVYYLITGKAPPPAVARMVRDELVPAREAGKGKYSDTFLAALDKALAVKPEQRFRSIAEMRRAVDIMETVPRTLPRTSSDLATTVMRTAPLAAPAPKVNAAPKETKPRIKPEAKQDMPRAAKAEVKPEIKREPPPKPAPPPQPTVYMQAPIRPNSVPDLDYWKRHERSNTAAARRFSRGKPSWLMPSLLLCAGIATGVYVYWASNHIWVNVPERSEVASGTAVESSGASEAPNQEAEAPTAVATAPSPSPSAPAETIASTAPPAAPATEEQPDRTQSELPLPSPETEIDQWRKASAANTASAYENYLKEYPKGRYAALAKLRLERMQPKTAKMAPPVRLEPKPKAAPPSPVPSTAPTTAASPTPAPSSEEEDLWTTVTTLNEAPAYEAYLHRYPKGRYAALAKDKLASLMANLKQQEPAASSTTPPVPPQEEPKIVQPTPREPEVMEKQASIKPAEPAVPPPSEATPATPTEPVPTGKKTITVGDQTMTGNFSADPKTGAVSGTGKIVWSNGDQFEGTLVQGKKQGKGKFLWRNGQRYSGDWERDMPNGKGSIVFPDGSRYEGEVKDGVPHGQGRTRFKSGDVYEGTWVRGKSHGQGRYTWANGSYWEGEFRDDRRTENGTMFFSKKSPDRTADTAQSPLEKAPSLESSSASSGGTVY